MKYPYFNSQSVPSFKLLDDEDDLGNYVEEPLMRRPVGPVLGMCVSVGVVKAPTCPSSNDVAKEVISEVMFFFNCYV